MQSYQKIALLPLIFAFLMLSVSFGWEKYLEVQEYGWDQVSTYTVRNMKNNLDPRRISVPTVEEVKEFLNWDQVFETEEVLVEEVRDIDDEKIEETDNQESVEEEQESEETVEEETADEEEKPTETEQEPQETEEETDNQESAEEEQKSEETVEEEVIAEEETKEEIAEEEEAEKEEEEQKSEETVEEEIEEEKGEETVDEEEKPTETEQEPEESEKDNVPALYEESFYSIILPSGWEKINQIESADNFYYRYEDNKGNYLTVGKFTETSVTRDIAWRYNFIDNDKLNLTKEQKCISGYLCLLDDGQFKIFVYPDDRYLDLEEKQITFIIGNKYKENDIDLKLYEEILESFKLTGEII